MFVKGVPHAADRSSFSLSASLEGLAWNRLDCTNTLICLPLIDYRGCLASTNVILWFLLFTCFDISLSVFSALKFEIQAINNFISIAILLNFDKQCWGRKMNLIIETPTRHSQLHQQLYFLSCRPRDCILDNGSVITSVIYHVAISAFTVH